MFVSGPRLSCRNNEKELSQLSGVKGEEEEWKVLGAAGGVAPLLGFIL